MSDMVEDFKSFFAQAGGGEGERCNYTTRLDTYGCGCAHDCAYCYAKSLLDFRGLWHPDKPGVASTDYISRKLRKVKPGTILRLGGMTDCFQPIEEIYGATAQAIRMMNARRIGYLIVTKSDLVASKKYMRLLDPELAHIQISVTSTSDEANFLNEKAVEPSKRIRAAETLSKAGFDVSLRISPYVPELVDLGRLNACKVDKCLVEFLRVNHWIKKWTGREWPEHIVKSGGYRHLPLEKKRKLLEGFGFPQMTVCEDVPGHFEYFKANYNHNPDDCCNLRRA
jgi:DNA repair photolyase